MISVESSEIQIESSNMVPFSRVSNFTILGNGVSDKISNFKATEDECSFDVANMAHISMYIQEKIPFSKVVIATKDGSTFPFVLSFSFEPVNENRCKSKVKAEVNVDNFILSSMLKPKLKELVNQLNQKLKETSEII